MKKGYDYLFESVEQLPPEIAEVVLQFKFTNGFRLIVNKYKLHLDQAEILEDMTFRVMFSEMSSSEFTAKLVSTLGLIPASAKELTDDTNTNIIEPVKKAIQERIDKMTEEYKDVELDESEMDNDEGATPSPAQFHPKSIYNEPIVDEPLKPAHHIDTTSSVNKLTHADVLHGIENPHSSIGNRPVKTASGSKSYSDIMATSNTARSEMPKKPEVFESGSTLISPEILIKPKVIPAAPSTPAPSLQQKVDLIAMKSSTVVVSSPTKISALPAKPANSLPTVSTSASTDPYKESI